MTSSKDEHYCQFVTVGPNIIVHCTTCNWRIVKLKSLSAYAFKAAREHFVVPKPARDKYEEMARKVPNTPFVSGAYHNWHVNNTHSHEDDKGEILHGGSLRKQTPRTGKYRGLNINGIKLK